MPTAAPLPIPAAMLPAGPLNPVDWLSLGPGQGLSQSAVMRGHPVAQAAYQRRQIVGPSTVAQGAPVYLHSRPYDRGAQAFSPKFGLIPINPIGAGIYAPYRIPTIAGPAARYNFGAIWFDVQTIPTTMPMSPTIPLEAVSALLATSHVAAMYPTLG